MSQRMTVDDFAQVANYYRHAKEAYQTAKQEYRSQVKLLEERVAARTVAVQRFTESITVVALPHILQQQLASLFSHRRSVSELFLRLLEHPAFIKDFCLLFPRQLTLITTLLSNSRDSLKLVYNELISHCSVRHIFQTATLQAIAMLNRYHENISINLEKTTSVEEELDFIKLNRNISQGQELYGKRVSLRVWERTGMSMEDYVRNSDRKVMEELELVDNVINSMLSSLFKNLPRFGLPLRYVLSLMSEMELLEIKLGWIASLEQELLRDSLQPSYVFNVCYVTSLLRTTAEKPHSQFKNPSLSSLFCSWAHTFRTFFRQLHEVSINDRLVEEYQQLRSLCCLSGATIGLLGIQLGEPLNPEVIYTFNPVDMTSNRRKPKEKDPKKSNFLRIDHEADWVELLRVTSSESPDIIQEECDRVRCMAAQLQEDSDNMMYRMQGYLTFLRESESALEKTYSQMQRRRIEIEAHDVWQSLIIQPNLHLVVEGDSLYFSSQSGKGCIVDTLSKFMQYLGLSRKISEMVRNALSVDKLNQIYCEYMGLVNAKIKASQLSEQLFMEIRRKVELYLYYGWQIDSGSSAKDLRAARAMDHKVVRLEDLQLAAFAADEEFYLKLAQPWKNQLAIETSPKSILGCFHQMSECVQYAMRLSKPTVQMAGDAHLSVTYFLIAKLRLHNLSSLLKYSLNQRSFMAVCWHEQQSFGQEEYMLTTLHSALEILLKHERLSDITEQIATA